MKRLLLAAALAVPSAMRAQDLPPVDPAAERQGPLLTLGYATAGWSSNDLTNGDTRSGNGFAASLGYGFSPRLALVGDLTVTGSVLEAGSSYLLYHAELLVRPSLRPLHVGRTEVVLFLDAGGGLLRLSGERPVPGDVQQHALTGSVITVGLGTAVFFHRRFALTLSGHGTIGAFSDEKVDNVTFGSLSIAAKSYRFAVGGSWHPQRPGTPR